MGILFGYTATIKYHEVQFYLPAVLKVEKFKDSNGDSF
jgi:hypothetical protein